MAVAYKIYQKGESHQGIFSNVFELFSVYGWNLFIGCMLQFLQNFSGYNLIQYYGPVIMRDAGFNSPPSVETNNYLIYGAMFVALSMVAGNLISIKIAN